MTETVKKTTGKKAKTTSEVKAKAGTKKAAATKGANGAAGTNGAPSNGTKMKLSHEQVAQLAHRFWAERGHQHGRHEEDWYRAEQELHGKAS